MSEEKVVEVPEEYLNSLKLSQMRADICKMAMNIKDAKSIENCHFFIRHIYVEELIESPCTVDEIAEEASNNLLYAILTLFKAETKETRVKSQAVKCFESEIEFRKENGLC